MAPGPLIPPIPDVPAFREAQDRLIDQLGQDVTFASPRVPQWPAGTQVDPENGRPYDPTVKPVAGTGGYNETVVRASVIYRPIRRGINIDPDTATPIGIMREETVALSVKAVDYPRIESATRFELNGLTYKITEIVPDGLTEVQRYIAFGESI